MFYYVACSLFTEAELGLKIGFVYFPSYRHSLTLGGCSLEQPRVNVYLHPLGAASPIPADWDKGGDTLREMGSRPKPPLCLGHSEGLSSKVVPVKTPHSFCHQSFQIKWDNLLYVMQGQMKNVNFTMLIFHLDKEGIWLEFSLFWLWLSRCCES